MEQSHSETNTHLKNILYANQDYKYAVPKRKHLLSLLLESFVSYKDSILRLNQIHYHIESNETNFLEILPVVLSFKNALSKLELWAATSVIDTIPSIHQKTFGTYTPKGLVCIILKTQLPFYYLFTTLTSAIAAGNKVIIHLVDYPEPIADLIKTIIETVFHPNHVLLLSTKQKIEQSIKGIDADYYTIISDENYYKKLSPQFIDTDNSKINFLNISNYKSCLIIDESSSVAQKMDKVFYSGLMCNGNLFFNNNLFLVHVDQLAPLRKSIADIQKKIQRKGNAYFIKESYKMNSQSAFDQYIDIIKKVAKENSSEILMGGETNENLLEVPPSIIQINPKSNIWKMQIKCPIILILPFYNIKDAINHLQELNPLNKVHLFSKNKFNINAVTSNLETELFLINELFMDRYNLNTIHADNKAFYKGLSGFATFSNLKTVTIKKQNTNFERLLFNKLDFISKTWFELFFLKK